MRLRPQHGAAGFDADSGSSYGSEIMLARICVDRTIQSAKRGGVDIRAARLDKRAAVDGSWPWKRDLSGLCALDPVHADRPTRHAQGGRDRRLDRFDCDRRAVGARLVAGGGIQGLSVHAARHRGGRVHGGRGSSRARTCGSASCRAVTSRASEFGQPRVFFSRNARITRARRRSVDLASVLDAFASRADLEELRARLASRPPCLASWPPPAGQHTTIA